jgi:hypothetical protein
MKVSTSTSDERAAGQMSDAELRRFGQAAHYMCSLQSTQGEPPREEFRLQLREARAEWRRRNQRRAPGSSLLGVGSGRGAQRFLGVASGLNAEAWLPLDSIRTENRLLVNPIDSGRVRTCGWLRPAER